MTGIILYRCITAIRSKETYHKRNIGPAILKNASRLAVFCDSDQQLVFQ